MMSDDIPVVGIIVYFHIYIVSNTSHLEGRRVYSE